MSVLQVALHTNKDYVVSTELLVFLSWHISKRYFAHVNKVKLVFRISISLMETNILDKDARFAVYL